MRLRHPVDYTIEKLTRLEGDLANCRGGFDAKDTRDRWLRWWYEADRQLRNLFTDDDITTSLYVVQEKIL